MTDGDGDNPRARTGGDYQGVDLTLIDDRSVLDSDEPLNDPFGLGLDDEEDGFEEDGDVPTELDGPTTGEVELQVTATTFEPDAPTPAIAVVRAGGANPSDFEPDAPTQTTVAGGMTVPSPGAMPRVGDVLGGYRIGGIAHEGSTTRVYEAKHTETGEPADIEVLLPTFAARPSAVERFFSQARVLMRLDHPNLVEIYDVIEWPHGGGCCVREPVHGIDLKTLLKRDDLPSLHRVIAIGAQICGALQAAHDEGLVHRDVKPTNIILTRLGAQPGAVKLTGFGTTELLNEEGTDVLDATTVGQLLGTPSYMAPEELGGFKIDFRIDLYAVGLVLYELVTGEETFQGDSVSEILDHVASETPRSASAVAPFGRGVVPALDELIAECLVKAPAMRPASAAEVGDRLKQIARPAPRRSSMPSPRISPSMLNKQPTGPRQKEASPFLLAGIGFFAAIVVGLAIIALLLWGESEASQPIPSTDTAAPAPGAER